MTTSDTPSAPHQTATDGLALTTRAVHVPIPANVTGRPVSVPIYQTTVFAFDDTDGITGALNDPRGEFGYSRFGNPTVRSLEESLAGLEGAYAAVSTASGMGAIAVAVSSALVAGDHIVVQRSIYGGTAGLFNDLVARWNIRITEVDGDDPEALRAAIEPGTKLLYLETISNPVTLVADIAAMSAVAREHGVLTVVDNTFASPVLCRPLELGADVVVHSTTKYIAGHSDVTGGIACFASEEQFRKAWAYAVNVGVTTDPHAAWLTLRGIQTLNLRVRQAAANARGIAERLQAHPAVSKVNHPSIATHPQFDLAARTLADSGAMLSFDLPGGAEAARTFTSSVSLIQLAASLGGVETLTMHPASSSHRAFTPEALAVAGITTGTVRLSVGIEDLEDIWADIEKALSAL
ncbi:aminotransferase class I/II-fold pyridoxal phosphate-dependent enzyme [Nakamurella silvestris]|nr:aminotransferase class I/II-fold pyridoxal phosphate-dependent enzyme [Nakamurella silvestris]